MFVHYKRTAYKDLENIYVVFPRVFFFLCRDFKPKCLQIPKIIHIGSTMIQMSQKDFCNGSPELVLPSNLRFIFALLNCN